MCLVYPYLRNVFYVSPLKSANEDDIDSYEVGDCVKLDDEDGTIGTIIKLNKKSVRISIGGEKTEMTVKFHEISKVSTISETNESNDDIEIEINEDIEKDESEMNKSIRKSIEVMIPMDTCLDVDEDDHVEQIMDGASSKTSEAKAPFTNSGMKNMIERAKISLFSPKPVSLSRRRLSSPKRIKTPINAKSTGKKSVFITTPSQQITPVSARKTVLANQSSTKKMPLSSAQKYTPRSIKEQPLSSTTGIEKTPVSGKKAPITPKSTKSQMLREEASLRKKRNFEEIQKQAQSEVDEFLQSSGVAIPPSRMEGAATSRVSTAPTPTNVNVSRRGGAKKGQVRSRSSTGIRKNSLSTVSTATSATKSKPKPKPNFDAIHAKEFSKSKSITNITPRDQHLNDRMTNALKQKLTSSMENERINNEKAFTSAVHAYNKSNIPDKFVKKSDGNAGPRKFKAKKMPNFGALHNKWVVKGANTSAAANIKENKPKNLVSGVSTFRF